MRKRPKSTRLDSPPQSERDAVTAAIVRVLTEEVENERFQQDPAHPSATPGRRLPAAVDPKQVLHNRESGINQRALRDRLLELGWRKNQIELIDEDQGRSAKHAAGREGFQRLVADVSLRKVGIIIGLRGLTPLAQLRRLASAAGVCALVRHPDRRRRRRL